MAQTTIANPLKWPEGWKRTKINARDKKGAWKKTLLQYEVELAGELRKMGAVRIITTVNDSRMAERDPGVAVYFSRPPAEDDGEWQDILGIDTPAPTVELINDRFKTLAQTYHPDNQSTGNYEMYRKIDDARKTAKAWVTGDFGKEHEHVIACDKYNEVRLNIKAIQISIAAIRKIEESGASGIIDRAFAGFTAPQIGEGNVHSARA